MFSEEAKTEKGSVAASTSRWGDNAVVYTDISLSSEALGDDDKELTISLTAKANRDVENPIFGFLIKSSSGAQILGTNSQIRKKTVPLIKSGEIVRLNWKVPNVFADGLHFIDPAIVYHDGTVISDWWEEAKEFTVFRDERTPYVISPHVGIEIEGPRPANEKN